MSYFVIIFILITLRNDKKSSKCRVNSNEFTADDNDEHIAVSAISYNILYDFKN